MPEFGLEYIDTITPLGLNLGQTYRSVSTGLQRFEESELYQSIPEDHLDARAEPQTISCMAWLERDQPVQEKFKSLFLEIVQRWLTDRGLGVDALEGAGLFWSFPDSPGLGFSSEVLLTVWADSGLPMPALCEVRHHGHSAMIELIQVAQSWGAEHPGCRCVIGGFECFIEPNRMGALDEQWRLKSARNPVGFIPAEAICILVLGEGGSTLGPVGLGAEQQAQNGEKHSTGQGLTQVLVACLPDEPLSLWGDLNGETYRFQEWGLVWSRLSARWPHAIMSIEHPFDCLGDCGAAAGGILIGLALESMRHSEHPYGLVFTGSDSGHRSAIQLDKGVVSCLQPQM